MKNFHFILLLIIILFTVGCVGNSKNGGIPTSTQSSITTPTVDESLWVTVVDNTYVLTATGKIETTYLRWKDIPVTPNTAYRLNVNGEKTLELQFYTKETGSMTERDYSIGPSNPFASRVTSYNGIVKPDPQFKNLRIEWILSPDDQNRFGTSQKVHVKLERYTGDSSIFPITTMDPYS
jgi:hypothetical protein